MKYIIFITLFSLCSCSIETTTGKVLENGNSAIKSSDNEVWWGAPEETTTADEDLTFEEREKKKNSKVY